VRDSITLVGGGCVSTIVRVEMIVLVDGGVTSVATTVSITAITTAKK
jgi:hypothetical protein